MRKWIMSAVGVAVTALVWGAAPASAANSTLWEQDFSTGTSGWYDGGAYGTITWDGATDQTATVTGTDSGPYTKFDGYRSTWPGEWMAEQDVYLDPSWASGSYFQYTVASSDSTGEFLRDFVFHVGVDSSGLWVFGDNNAYGAYYKSPAAESIPATAAGWYTLQQVFADDNGVLAVTMNVLDAGGNTVYTTTRSDSADTIPGAVGGNRYGWFYNVDVPGGLKIDNTRLSLVLPSPGTKDDCKDGGFTSFGFDNQGQCVASVTANANAGK
jgi:hypothetical protein